MTGNFLPCDCEMTNPQVFTHMAIWPWTIWPLDLRNQLQVSVGLVVVESSTSRSQFVFQAVCLLSRFLLRLREDTSGTSVARPNTLRQHFEASQSWECEHNYVHDSVRCFWLASLDFCATLTSSYCARPWLSATRYFYLARPLPSLDVGHERFFLWLLSQRVGSIP